MDLKHLIFFLLFLQGAGMLFTLPFVRPDVGRRYFWMHALFAIGLALPAFPWVFLAATAVYAWLAPRRVSLLPWAIAIGAAAEKIFSANASLVAVANSTQSMLLLGFGMMAMLLGHWYLIQPKLSIDELGRICKILIALIVLRFVFSSVVIGQILAGKSEADIYKYLLGTGEGIFVLMRWTWGLVGPLALSYFVWGTVKIRSTQSATGILYVVVLAILTGETLSQYLNFAFGIPC